MRLTHSCAAILLILPIAACARDNGPALATPTFDTLPGGAIAVHNTGPSAWVDTSGWRIVETGKLVAVDSGESGIVNPRDVAVDASGRLYVVDGPPLVIKVFEPDGRFVRAIGREGAGPGEFRSAMIGLHENHIVVQDPNLARLTIFDTSGTYVTSLASACCHYRSLPVTANGTVAIPGPNSRPEYSGMFLRFTAAGDFVDTVYVPKGGEERYWELAQDGGSMRMTIPFTPGQRSAFTPSGDLVHAWTGDYRIIIGRNAADTSRVITLTSTPVERPEAERREYLETRLVVPNEKNWGPKVRQTFKFEDIPATATPFENIMVDPAGAIWAQVYTRDTLATHYDVFDSTGVYLGRVKAPWQPSRAVSWGSPELAARIEENEDGYPQITTYRVERSVRSAE